MSSGETRERWLPVPGYEGLYEVSDAGNVRSLERTVTATSPNGNVFRRRHAGRILKPIHMPTGHLCLNLANDGVITRYYIHVLVLLAFVGPPQDGQQACHYDDVGTNNQLSNLRWDTCSANALDRTRNNRNLNANKTHCKRGHEFTGENTYPRNGGRGRNCRQCARSLRPARRRTAG